MFQLRNLLTKYAVDSRWKYLYGSLLFFSLCSGAVIPIIYTFSSKCRHHPAQIVLILCLLEMITCYQFFLDSVCFIELIEFLNKTIKYRDDVEIYTFGLIEESGTFYNQVLCQVNQAIILISFIAQLNYYIVLTLDFIITLKRPFMNTKLKLFTYHLGAIIFTILLSVLEMDEITKNCNKETCEDQEIDKLSQYFIVQLLIIFILLITSIYFGIKDLKNMKKINESVRNNRKQLFINHIILIITLLLMWSLPLILRWLTDELQNKLGSALTRIYFAVMLIHPSILLWIRLREPYFKSRAFLLMQTIFCKRKWKENKDENEDNIIEAGQLPLNQLVQQQNNQETIKNILSSILKAVVYDQTLTDVPKQSKHTRSYQCNKSEEIQADNTAPFLWSVDGLSEITLNIKITEYAPAVFQDLRERNGIDHNTFEKSLRLELNKNQIQKTQESLGKSGSFFFYTYDETLVLKTIGLSELELLRKILPDYYVYFATKNFSLIAKIYGLFSISIEGFSQIHLMLMENIFQNMPKNKIVYDLKGSLVNRKSECNNDNKVDVTSSIVQYKPSDAVFKDMNFITSTDIFIQLNQLDRENLFNIIKDDLEFLQGHKLMDYSLLIAISKQSAARGKRNFCNSQNFYSFGLIDYTQQFTFRKKLEYFYKYHVKRRGGQISCVDPTQYCQRFFAFINSVIIINNNA